jgi:hypothetical protein
MKVLAGGIAGGIAALMLGLVTVPVRAQTSVQGGVVVESGPVAAHVEVGSPPPPVVAREVIVVERVKAPHGKKHDWWKKHGYRVVTVYYDGRRYYGRRLARPGMRQVIVYERKGRYYLSDEYGRWRDHGRRGDYKD